MKNLEEQYEQIVKQMQDAAMPIIMDNAKEVFDANPRLESFSVYMFAKYFNDGDPCPFYIRDYMWNINGRMCSDYEYPEEITEHFSEEELKNIDKSIENFARCLPNELAQRIFGDDQVVTFNRDGTFINERYGEHD